MEAPIPLEAPVTTATAKSGDIRIYLDAIGTVTPVYTDTITAQVTGVITAVHYREGQPTIVSASGLGIAVALSGNVGAVAKRLDRRVGGVQRLAC